MNSRRKSSEGTVVGNAYPMDAIDSERVAVGELAMETTKETKRARIALPLAAAILSILIPALCLTIIPSAVILVNAMLSSSTVLTTSILTSVVDHVNIQVTSYLNTTSQTVLSLIQSPNTFDVITRPSNFTTDTRTNLWVQKVLSQTDFLSSASFITCQRRNLNNNAPANAPANVGVNVWWGQNSVYWCDYSSFTQCFVSPVDQVTGVAGPATPFPQVTPEKANAAFTCAVQAACPKSGGVWKPELVFGTLWLTYAACAQPVSQFGSTSPYSSSIPLLAGDKISSTFAHLKPSVNSRIFMIDTQGHLLASSANGSVANAAGTDFVAATSANDTVIAQLSQLIKTQTNSFTSFSSLVGALYRTTLSSGDQWTYSVAPLTVASTSPLYLIAAIPRRDYFASIDDAQRSSIIVTSVFGIASMVIVVLAIIGITFPVRKLTAEMAKVANFDFSMLERGFFVENSLFSEIRNMQSTFNTLVKAFAGAIKRNKAMNQNSSGALASSDTKPDTKPAGNNTRNFTNTHNAANNNNNDYGNVNRLTTVNATQPNGSSTTSTPTTPVNYNAALLGQGFYYTPGQSTQQPGSGMPGYLGQGGVANTRRYS
ncbi:hypothetical protein BJ742DRAFT_805294 [Cladochytrium replicatum]|nr:hypothetical protein BJ742DRAFT_805294 [Cladochytrium replicatum]